MQGIAKKWLSLELGVGARQKLLLLGTRGQNPSDFFTCMSAEEILQNSELLAHL